MKEKVKVKLKDGKVCFGYKYDLEAYKIFQKIFKRWLENNEDLEEVEGRHEILSEVVSEGLVSIFFNAIRTPKSAYSYDCVSLKDGSGIQVKATSIEKDCSSFGPTSTWDELYFVDFAPNGIVNGETWFYRIDYDFSSIILNASKGETFKDQQAQGRRPRFSIKKTIIQPQNLKPILKINLLNEEIPTILN